MLSFNSSFSPVSHKGDVMGESVMLLEEPEERLCKLECLEYISCYVLAALIETTCV